MARQSPRRRGDGGKGGKGDLDNAALELHDSVMHACGGCREVAREVIALLDEALTSGTLVAARPRVAEFLRPLEDSDGEREGRDRGSHRFLKAVNVLLRLKGFNSRDRMMPIREIELTGQPLLAFTAPNRGAGAPPGRPEPVVRSLELAVHLARSSNHVVVMRLGECELSADGGDKCVTEVARLVRQVGIGAQARFLEEVDLHGNTLDAEAVRKIVEAAVKERCERPRACAGAPPMWLDLSQNRVRNPATVFQNLQAWASWAHDKDYALCLADLDGCTRKHCPKGCLLHMPGFNEQSKLDGPQAKVTIGTTAEKDDALTPAAPAPRPAMLPPKPQAWRDVEDLPRSQALVRGDPGRTRRSPSRRRRRDRSRSRRRRRRRSPANGNGAGANRSPSPVRVVLKPGPGTTVAIPPPSTISHRKRRSRSSPSPRVAAAPSAGASSEPEPEEEEEEMQQSPGGSVAGSQSSAGGSPVGSGAEDSACEDEASDAGSASGPASASGSEASQDLGEGGSSASASPLRPAPSAGGGAPTPAELEQRMNRLIESLKGSTSAPVAAAAAQTAARRTAGRGAAPSGEQKRSRNAYR